MLDLDSKAARTDHSGWVLFNNVKWLLHEGHCVVLAVTTPKALSDSCAAICAICGRADQFADLTRRVVLRLLSSGEAPPGGAMAACLHGLLL